MNHSVPAVYLNRLVYLKMTVRVKICGITQCDDALLAEELGVSAVGFVFYPQSPRSIKPEDARFISESLGPFIARVGVFVDEDPTVVAETAAIAGLTTVQLHGSENPDYLRQLSVETHSRVPLLGIIKVFRVGPDFDPEELRRCPAGAYLLDAFEEGRYGGTGKTFDWERVLPCLHYGKIILAGGLTADNITEALRIVKPWGVDVSSGVERKPGIKDHGKMKMFFKKIQMESLR